MAAMTALIAPGWEPAFKAYLEDHAATDSAHDLAHIKRVRANALKLAAAENADLAIILPAVWLHDCVNIPKSSPSVKFASRLAAEEASRFLESIRYPAIHHAAIYHAIEAHSFSAGVAPLTIEAKIIQDADRLDALGAIGLARCFSVGGSLNRPIYSPGDPFARARDLNDDAFSIDHFFVKLLRIGESMQTKSGKGEAAQRTEFLRHFINQFSSEIGVDTPFKD